jgi:hypothetical protein
VLKQLSPGLLRRATAAALILVAMPAHASEGGASFYLLGSGGPGAGVLPPLRGVFFDNTAMYYHGETKGDRQFVVGGNLVAGLDVTMLADFATVLWVPSTDFAGGTLAVGGAFAAGRPDAKVSAVITGPRGGQVTISRLDEAWIVGDPVATAALGWNLGGNTHLATSATANIPVGHYREGQLANLSFHRWVLDWSTALSWHDPNAGWDVSGKAGVTFNGKNDFTDYNTGTEFHLEGTVERMFSSKVSAGLLGYHFQQLSGDSGSGATLGPFKGRVTGLGLTGAYNFEVGHTPVTLRARAFKEFGEKNRLGNGTAVMINLDFPLKMVMPAASPSAQQGAASRTTFKDFPPLQRPGTFTIDDAVVKMADAGAGAS